MKNAPRLSFQTLRVLQLFVADPTAELAGIELLKHTQIASGTLYPILGRLEEADWLQSRWEKIDTTAEKRPRRRYYSITPLGIRSASSILAKLSIGKIETTGLAPA